MNALREARRAVSMTQAQVASAAGVSQSFVAHMEAGRRRPAIDVGVRIARALGTTVDALFGALPTDEPVRPAAGQ